MTMICSIRYFYISYTVKHFIIRYKVFFNRRCCGYNFKYWTWLISVTYCSISPLCISCVGQHFFLFFFILNFFKWLQNLRINYLIRLVWVKVRFSAHCEYCTRFYVHNNTVTIACIKIGYRPLQTFIKVILYYLVNSQHKACALFRVICRFVFCRHITLQCIFCRYNSTRHSS